MEEIRALEKKLSIQEEEEEEDEEDEKEKEKEKAKVDPKGEESKTNTLVTATDKVEDSVIKGDDTQDQAAKDDSKAGVSVGD